MKNWFALWFLLAAHAGGFALAQDGSSPPATVNIEVLDGAPAAELKEQLLAAVEAYWTKKRDGDFMAVYNMYVPEFKEEIPMDKFLMRSRGQIEEYTLKSVKFKGEGCAFVSLRLKLNAESMALNKVPVRQTWVWRDQKWLLFDQPHKNPMMTRQRKSLKTPCEWPKREVPTNK